MDNTQEISPEEWEEIESYLHSNMPLEERSHFDARLADDLLLQAKVNEVRLLLIGVNEAVLQSKLATFHKELPNAEKEYRIAPKNSSLKTWLIAASILLFAGVAGWFVLLNEKGGEALSATYYKPDPGLITAMSATENYAFEKSMIDYKQGNYALAIQTWDSLQKLQPANDTLNYFLGVAHLADRNSNKAISYLKKVAAMNSSFFKADANWYLGLALLKEGRKEEAQKAIQRSSHPAKEALLQKMK